MIEIGHFVPADYDEVMALWCHTEGLTLREADSCEAITHYPACNLGLSPRRLTSRFRFVSRMSPDSRFLVPATDQMKTLLALFPFPAPQPTPSPSHQPAPPRLRFSERPDK